MIPYLRQAKEVLEVHPSRVEVPFLGDRHMEAAVGSDLEMLLSIDRVDIGGCSTYSDNCTWLEVLVVLYKYRKKKH